MAIVWNYFYLHDFQSINFGYENQDVAIAILHFHKGFEFQRD